MTTAQLIPQTELVTEHVWNNTLQDLRVLTFLMHDTMMGPHTLE